MSVWSSPCYRDFPFQSVAKHLAQESLHTPFVNRLLDFDIDHTDNLVLQHNRKPGNVRRQVEFGDVHIKDLIRVSPAIPSVEEDWEAQFDETFDQLLQQDIARREAKVHNEERRAIITESSTTTRRITFSRDRRSSPV